MVSKKKKGWLARSAAFTGTGTGTILELDLEALEVTLDSEAAGECRWPVHLDPGPRSMLVSGQWDGTSQLLSHDGQLLATAERLPYLQGFPPASVAPAN